MDVDDDLARALEVGVEQAEALGSGGVAARPASTMIVSQKMLAVSASAIGVWRCSGVRSARLVLW